MPTLKKPKKSQRVMRSDEYRKDAVKLSETVGVTESAKQLGMHTTQVDTWRNKIRVKESRSDAEIRLMDENAIPTRELVEKKSRRRIPKKGQRVRVSRTRLVQRCAV